MTKKFYITTPAYYPNAKPHLGTLYSSVIADVATRWQKLMGKDVFFLTGTDEHGQKLQEAAEAQGKKPREFVDEMIPAFKHLWQLYEIEYTKFIRTTDAGHIQGIDQLIKKLQEQGDIYKSTYSGWYCVGCEAFVTESDAVKDEKGVYHCALHKKPLSQHSEEGYFFRLSAYQDQLLKFYEQNPDFIVPKERLNEIISFVKAGLKDLSISRKNVKWGIPFPGDPAHTVYVWVDALPNYITGIGYGQPTQQDASTFKQWWPADLHVMAKDIFRFHAVIWPALLIAAGLALPKKLLVHGYILVGEQKMSKSLGNCANPEQLATWYGIEAIRYYLTRQMAITHDGNFDLKDLEERITADLANNLGNLLNRMLTLAHNNHINEVKVPATLEPSSAALKERCGEAFRAYWDEMNKYSFHCALAECFKFVSDINAYFHTQQPWTLPTKNKELFNEVIASTCQGLYATAIMLWPIMPKKMETLLASIGHSFKLGTDYEKELRDQVWNKIFTLAKPSEPLFVKPESHCQETSGVKEPSPSQPSSSEITIDEFAKIQLCIGTIDQCEKVQGSDKLYKLQVNLGTIGNRQILSGVAQHFKPEDLIGKQGVFVVNLKPRKMMGLESHGMMLLSEDETGALKLVTTDGIAKNGAKIR